MTSEEKKRRAEALLREKRDELGRLPKKEDFDEVTKSRIKAFLGPWPRALEAAGLKEPSEKKQNGNRKKRRRHAEPAPAAGPREAQNRRAEEEPRPSAQDAQEGERSK